MYISVLLLLIPVILGGWGVCPVFIWSVGSTCFPRVPGVNKLLRDDIPFGGIAFLVMVRGLDVSFHFIILALGSQTVETLSVWLVGLVQLHVVHYYILIGEGLLSTIIR